MKVTVLRLGHRKKRDVRVTTHCCLTARALLADALILSGEEDPAILETIRKVSAKWGGKFRISYDANWRKRLRSCKKRGDVLVHLTMYGRPLLAELAKIRKEAGKRNLMVIIGSQKVPPEVYSIADFNISVTSQPHSEVAALAVFLAELKAHSPLLPASQKHFRNAKIRLVPGKKGGRKV